MKKKSLVILFSTIISGAAYASVQAGQSQMAFALPQPCTIFICTAGMAFVHYLTRKRNQ